VLAGLLLAVSGCGTGDAPASRLDDEPDRHRRGPQGRLAQFVVECELSHLAFDDPIVSPGQPGASHLHQFFGNAEVDTHSEYDQIIGAATTCDEPRDTASYWAPALLDAAGKRVEPLGLTAYYRPGNGVTPADIVAYPAGLMLIGGDAGASEPQPTDIVAWSCGTGAIRQARPPACPSGSTLRMMVTFPDCWDGTGLGGLGPGEHMRYSDGGCPDGYPVPLPQLMIAIDYPPIEADDLSLASGSILTGHADFWNVWDQEKLEQEVALCLNRNLVCGLGEGRRPPP
jgi:hypothetical protein